jgi:hypothetical protein
MKLCQDTTWTLEDGGARCDECGYFVFGPIGADNRFHGRRRLGRLWVLLTRLLTLALFLCLLGTAHAFDVPFLGLFCQGNCSYSGSWTYNDPNGILTSTVTATATGNLGGNSGQIQGSLFTNWGGTCWYSLVSDPGCTFLLYPFQPAANGGCAPSGNTFHFCFQAAGQVCQETFSGGWNANSVMHGAYINISMQSALGVMLNVNGQCPPNRPAILTVDLGSVPMQDCDGYPNSSGSPIPPFYCNENFMVVAPSEANGNPITGTLNRSDPDTE